MSLKTLALIVLGTALAACSKSSVAQPGFEALIESIAHLKPDASTLAEGSTMNRIELGTGGEPHDGTVDVPLIQVGLFEWTKYKLEKDEPLPSGDRILTISADICMRPDDADNTVGTCTRPNSYRFRALMRNQAGAWKVAGAAFTNSAIIR
jgi:hypothetical protein